MPGFTNRGKFLNLQGVYRNTGFPINFYMALLVDTVAPGPDTNLMSDVSEVPAGNGYTAGGIQLGRNATDFDVLTEDDANDRALAQIRDLVWTAAGGNLPSSGSGARYSALTHDDVTVANRAIHQYFDLVSNRIVSIGQTLTLQNCEIRLNEG